MQMGQNQKYEEPAIGVPYYVGHNPYQAGAIPPNAVFGDPKGIPIQQTIYRDTPAPINCAFCGSSGVTHVRSKPSLAAVVGCMMPFMLGCCFLCPSMDCLWHKYHYCPHCNEKITLPTIMAFEKFVCLMGGIALYQSACLTGCRLRKIGSLLSGGSTPMDSA